MRLSKYLLTSAAGLLLLLPTCAHRTATGLSPGNEILQKIIYSIADKRERREFDRAVKIGPYTLKVFLENLWLRRDPLLETDVNEYQMRFEARFSEGSYNSTPPGGSYPDDRVIAYVLYGTPTSEEEFSLPSGDNCVGWIYRPDPEIADAGSGHRLLKHLDFAMIFQIQEDGSHTMVPSGVDSWRPPPEQLSYNEVLNLEGILSRKENDGYLRAAAAWRLRADPSQRALKALLMSAPSEDPIVEEAIADAIQPLIVKRIEGSDDLIVTLAEPDSRLQIPREGDSYNPAALYHPQTVASINAAAASADSFLHSHGWLEQEEADALYVGPLETARFILDSENPMDAHYLLEPLLKGDYGDNPEAWHLGALALLESATPGGRRQSEERIRKALRLDPGNLRYRLTLARILDRRTFAYYADDTLDRILDEAPTLADAYALKARMRFEHYWRVGWRAGGWGGTPFDERRKPGNIRRAEATDMLNRALILDPDNAFATWWLGWHYVLARRWREVVLVMNYLIREGVHVPEALLARGMAHQHLGRLELAYLDYETALSMLPSHIRAMAEDPRWVVPPSEGGITLQRRIGTPDPADPGSAYRWEGAGGQEPEEERDRFWRAKDPLFSSSINERLLEQHRRLAYVTWHFAVPNLGLRGWETHRGRIYLRYGEPIEFQEIERALQRISEEAGSNRESTGESDWEYCADLARAVNLATVWSYPGLRVTFHVGFVTGNFSVNQPAKFQRDVELEPESARVEGARRVLRMDAAWYYFENPDRDIELIPVIEVPILYAQQMESPGGMTEDCPVKLVILDSDWRPTHQTNYRFSLYRQGGRVQRYWVGQPMVLPAGTPPAAAAYSAAELLPPEPKLAFAARDTLPEWTESGLRLSSLVLAKGIAQRGSSLNWLDGTFFIRNDQAVMPRPGGVFSPTEPVYLYTEIYGLVKDAYGSTSYQVSLSLTALGEEKGLFTAIVDALGNLLRRESREGTVTLLFDREGISTHVHEKLRIAFPEELEADRFIVQVSVTDKVTGGQTERSILLSMGK